MQIHRKYGSNIFNMVYNRKVAPKETFSPLLSVLREVCQINKPAQCGRQNSEQESGDLSPDNVYELLLLRHWICFI